MFISYQNSQDDLAAVRKLLKEVNQELDGYQSQTAGIGKQITGMRKALTNAGIKYTID